MHSKSATARSKSPRYPGPQHWWVRVVVGYCLTLLLLLLLNYATFVAMQIPLAISTSSDSLRVTLDGSTLGIPLPASPTQILFVQTDPALREFQLDGTDNINNFSEDLNYIRSIENTPYYRFQAWMRDLATYSSRRAISIRSAVSGRLTSSVPVADSSTLLTLPGGGAVVSASIERLEIPVEIDVFCGKSECGTIQIDRNDRFVQVQSLLPDGTTGATQKAFFPYTALPFVADVANVMIHTLIWSLLLLGLLAVLQVAILALPAVLTGSEPSPTQPARRLATTGWHAIRSITEPTARWWREQCLEPRRRLNAWVRKRIHAAWFSSDRWDLTALAVTLAACGFTVWIALVEYHAEPHILDASAYIFQAKIFASRQLSAPVPVNLAAFQGPFMVAYQGRWFAQYAPGTSALLALGLLLHVPWLVEPILGSCALFGIYKIGRLMFSPAEALLALLLGALSAFYLFLAASYLSHTIALFFGVYYVLALLHFDRRPRQHTLVLAAICAGGLFLTRELSAVLVCGGSTLVLLCLHSRQWWLSRGTIARMAILPACVLGGCAVLYLLYNAEQTGSLFLLPRTLFNPDDRYGFGQGIGFYGQHTVAAGFVNLDQLLTVLLIDLYGWPFYLTLAFVPLAFLRCLRELQWDVFCLGLASLLIVAQVGYFYHGIYLGPRYLLDALPFLLLLTARGMTALYYLMIKLAGRIAPMIHAHRRRIYSRSLVVALVVMLMGCTLLYYLPRQIVLYHNYSGLPVSEPLQVTAIYTFHPENGLVVTSDWFIYNYVLFPLNDPSLNGQTLYAYAADSASIQRLLEQYPDRNLYQLQVGSAGVVTFVEIER
jgi:Dolichyl-phosphate-mannose-protein mannosyltransferase